jgi:two-component system, OmpR family, phosphate regulon sensor histidine kinase PhoR
MLAVCLLLLAWTGFRLGRRQRDVTLLELDLHLERDRLKEAREDNSFLTGINRSFIDQARSAMLLLDGAGKVRYFNPAAARLFKLGPSAEGKPIIEAVQDHDLNLVVQNVFRTGETPQKAEFRPVDTDLELQATADAVRNERGDLLGVTLVIEDLTELHRLELVRREFVANVSHELRTPLATVKALVETLEAGAIEEKERAHDFLAKMNRELDRLAALVRDLLELSRIESRRITLRAEPFDMGAVVRDAMDQLRPAAERAGLAISLSQDQLLPQTVADPDRTKQVLLNLIQNAIKFTPSPGKLLVGLSASDACIEVAVQDTGVGIPAHELPRIFERFYKVDKGRAHDENSGTGLGLAIAKHLISAMGGSIRAESVEGKGSTFRFTLPAAMAAEKEVLV